MVVAPSWHICPMGTDGAMPGKQMIMAHAHMMPKTASARHITNQLNNQPVPEDFCLARMLQHVLGNSQFRLVLNFNSVIVSILADPPAGIPLIRALLVNLARGPPIISQ
jgi:hypothetical protein